MQQTTLALDDSNDAAPPRLELEPDREQKLVQLMAEAILAVMLSTREGTDDDR